MVDLSSYLKPIQSKFVIHYIVFKFLAKLIHFIFPDG